jgi:hypothetical protein
LSRGPSATDPSSFRISQRTSSTKVDWPRRPRPIRSDGMSWTNGIHSRSAA